MAMVPDLAFGMFAFEMAYSYLHPDAYPEAY
jgi:hypothetical protein